MISQLSLQWDLPAGALPAGGVGRGLRLQPGGLAQRPAQLRQRHRRRIHARLHQGSGETVIMDVAQWYIIARCFSRAIGFEKT